MRKRLVSLIVGLAAGAAALALFSAGGSASSGAVKISVRDACDPATFNLPPPDGPAANGPICLRDASSSGGRVTFGDFVNALIKDGKQGAWRFNSDHVTIGQGQSLAVVHEQGGEFHTFTEVAAFGGGCVPPINALLGLTPIAECAGFPGAGVGPFTSGPGSSLAVSGLSVSTHKFQCLIHPWMRTVVTVE